jgi:hypothetical protein
VSRDRVGEPRCADCPDTAGDPLAKLVAVVTGLDSALDATSVLDALGRATVRPAGQPRLAWAVTARPDLLAGARYASLAPAVLRFIDELVAAGATKVVRPACPRCRQVKALSKLLDGLRVYRACFARHAAVGRARCGAVREPAARDAEGQPLCPNCLIRDPANREDCQGCGRRRPVAIRLPDGPRCMSCRPRTVTECSICGRTAICDTACGATTSSTRSACRKKRSYPNNGASSATSRTRTSRPPASSPKRHDKTRPARNAPARVASEPAKPAASQQMNSPDNSTHRQSPNRSIRSPNRAEQASAQRHSSGGRPDEPC